MGHLRHHNFLDTSSKMHFKIFETLPTGGLVMAEQRQEGKQEPKEKVLACRF